MKRGFDLFFSFVGLIILVPLFFAIAAAIKLESRGPVFYRGVRIGLEGQKFRIFKFRTMVADADRRGGTSTKEDDPRLTRMGRFLRRFKLDELPQLLNVLAGDMSFVGPRPQVQWAVDLYTEEERRLLTVRPGITDYASLRFRNEGEILRGYDDPDKAYMELIAPEKMRLGLYYVENRSMWMDLKLVILTALSVFRGEGR